MIAKVFSKVTPRESIRMTGYRFRQIIVGALCRLNCLFRIPNALDLPEHSATGLRIRVPVEAVLGGAETMYPEYRKKLKDSYVAPERCTRYCCGWGGAPGNPAPGLTCVTDGGAPR